MRTGSHTAFLLLAIALPIQVATPAFGARIKYMPIPLQLKRICKPLLQGTLTMGQVAPLLRSMGYTIIARGSRDAPDAIRGIRKKSTKSPSVLFTVEPRSCEMSTRGSLDVFGDVFEPWGYPADRSIDISATNPPDASARITDHQTFSVAIGKSFGRSRVTVTPY